MRADRKEHGVAVGKRTGRLAPPPPPGFGAAGRPGRGGRSATNPSGSAALALLRKWDGQSVSEVSDVVRKQSALRAKREASAMARAAAREHAAAAKAKARATKARKARKQQAQASASPQSSALATTQPRGARRGREASATGPVQRKRRGAGRTKKRGPVDPYALVFYYRYILNEFC